jgi:hypothetical protein
MDAGGYVGSISLEASLLVGEDGGFFSAAAQFYQVGSGGSNALPTLASLCGTQAIIGDCCFEPSSSVSQAAGINAGTLSLVDNGPTGTGSTSLGTAVQDGNTEFYDNWTVTAWDSGDKLTVSATGATIDAFSIGLQAPDNFVGLNPSLFLEDGGAGTVPLATPFTITWTSDTPDGGFVWVVLEDNGPTGGGEVFCYPPADTGTFTVPTAMLSNFSSGDTGAILLDRFSVSTQPYIGNVQLNTQVETELQGNLNFE